MQVFNPYEFPDVPSGSVSEKLVDLGYETFIRIDSSTLVTEDETRRYSAQTVRFEIRDGCCFYNLICFMCVFHSSTTARLLVCGRFPREVCWSLQAQRLRCELPHCQHRGVVQLSDLLFTNQPAIGSRRLYGHSDVHVGACAVLEPLSKWVYIWAVRARVVIVIFCVSGTVIN